MRDLATQVRSERRRLGLSVSELARRAGISRAYLHRLESPQARSRPSTAVAVRLAAALGLSIADLTGLTAPKAPPDALVALNQATTLSAAELAALRGLASLADPNASQDDWTFILLALRRSVLRAG